MSIDTRWVLALVRAVLAIVMTHYGWPKVVKEILEHLGLPTTGPPIATGRIAAVGKDAPWQDDGAGAAANAALRGGPAPIP